MASAQELDHLLLIDYSLPPGCTARVARKGDRLGILLEANTVPERSQALVVQSQLPTIPGIQTCKVYGRQRGQIHAAWCLVFPKTQIQTGQEKLYGYFVTEAQELMNSLEQDLLSFREDHSLGKIHNMLLAVHTIKGGSASVGLQTIAKIAHGMEDVFAALRHAEGVLELEPLLRQGYECLRVPLMAKFAGMPIDEPEALNRAASVIAEIQEKLGDCFNREMPILTSADLGFDIVQNLFQVSVAQRLGELERSLLSPHPPSLTVLLQEKAELFLGLAESMNLPGFRAIAQTTLIALQLRPHQVVEIATLALADFSEGRLAVLAGDRQAGGVPSVALQNLATSTAGNEPVNESLNDLSLYSENLIQVPMTELETQFNELSPLSNFQTLDTELSLDEVFGQYGG